MKESFLRLIAIIFIFTLPGACLCCARDGNFFSDGPDVIPGAYRTELYFPFLEGKRIGVVGNHTSRVGGRHLTDTLLSKGFDIVRVFSPEHGFRGIAAAGEIVEDGKDIKTGLPVISLYADNRRPKYEHLQDIDVIIFDIQDVGARFYTYISTMTYVIEEAAKKDIPVIILDRPNPNGHYIDGPVLEPEFSSFVGLHSVPVVHGMTVGEYALMINGEGWLADDLKANIKVVEVAGYDHSTPYELPVSPSPNLPNMTAVYLYPSLCFFEGTVISVGRGTSKPFQIFGHPDLPEEIFNYQFIPESVSAAPNPPLINRKCFGMDLSTKDHVSIREKASIDLSYLKMAYQNFAGENSFFNDYFDVLAGTKKLRKQIEKGYTIEQIRESWEADLNNFKKIREKYLLYDDFE